MADAAIVIRRFAAHEFSVRRLYASDQEFRLLCDDYADAVHACSVWRHDIRRAGEYRRLIDELEDEILEFLEAHRPTTR
ncbi:MAG: hypothetical protein MnENMB40S_14920 [Rhizobiaceae bacterium MnEN-MB40S]|nr:MAG: hypothetical protein MnENMB40S_14920 [Rhizobiaceae bacterium MnEN-MB40S]